MKLLFRLLRRWLAAFTLAVSLAACGGSAPDEPIEISDKQITTGLEFTADYAVAKNLIQSGKRVVLPVGFITDGTGLLPNASEILDLHILQNSYIYSQPGLLLEVADELFWVDGKVSSREDMEMRYRAVLDVIALVKMKLPNARLGILFNPEVYMESELAREYIRILQWDLHWMATNIYFWHTSQIEYKLQAAREFADLVHIDKLLVFPGFAPVDFGNTPALWTDKNLKDWQYALDELFKIYGDKYQDGLIWGWNATDTSEGLIFGNAFPDRFKAAYLKNLKDICL